MNPQETLIRGLYTAMSQKDQAAVGACYHPEAEFNDLVFSAKGKHIRAMWHMLSEVNTERQMTIGDIEADEGGGRAHWEPSYKFGLTGRRVHNVIDSQFRFKDGLIVWQRDTFDFWRWARMALGVPGVLLGWTPLLRNKIKAKARDNLAKFIAAHPEYQ
ncbi:MAG: nuclear transport factor 2 family protein [Deltaproteobacteria bacterium]|nr:nuclear transport factor 2 family protein [Deltaproteobacteria bacterium]